MKLLSKVWMLGIASLLGFTLIGCGSSSNLELKKDTFTVEYGEKISTNAKDYLKKDTDKEVLKDAKIAIKKLKNENDKEYPKVGKYDAVATYEDETKKFTIEVKDTVKPKFVDFAEAIEVEQGYSEDIATKFKASDLSEVTITVDKSKVDFNIVGEYEIKVTAKDKYKNKTKETVKVIVKEKAEEEAENTANENVPVTGTNGNTSSGSTNNGGYTGGNTSGGTSSGTTSTPTPSAPYITDDGRSYCQMISNGNCEATMNSPIFNTEPEAYNWAMASDYWNVYFYGFGTCGISYSDGSEKYSVYWYN